MGTKVDEASIDEPHHVQTTVTAKASAASTNSPKISMFAGKSGFVIPKNKLSGSLVPIYRGGRKPGRSDAVNEESTTQVQRKTKWGPDLTQDAAVRKGRALAYQTRVEQITKQLNLGRSEMGDNQDSVLADENADESSIHQVKSKKSELLELEKVEAIGELLKLNPTYKAPPDYKPLLKEAKVPVPIKEYPGYNFIGLIFGNASDTQKRLEKETGAKLRVYGTKADTREKCEIAHSDGIGEHGAYEELYVQISADTYEKVDAAASLLELLVTPVSVNPTAVSTTPTSASGDSVKVADQSQGTSSPYTIRPVGINAEVAQPIMGSLQTPQGGPLRPYQSPWFPAGPPQNFMLPPSGFILPPNPSAPMLRNPVQASPLQVNPSNMPSLFGPRPVLAPGLGSGPQNSSHVPSRPQAPVLQHPFMPQQLPFGPGNPSFPTSQPPPAQSSISAPPPFVSNQPPSTGPTPPLGQGGQAWMGPNMVPPQRLNLVTSQPLFVSGAPPSNISAASKVPPPRFSPMPAPRLTQSSSPANAPILPVMARGVGPTPSPSLLLGSMPPLATTSTPPPPPQSGIPSSISVNAPSFTPIKPPSLTAQKPHHPNSGDFTFQPHRPQNIATQSVPRLPIQNMPLPNTTAQPPLAPNTRPFWPHMPPPSLQLSNQMNPPQTQISPFVGNPTAARAPLRHPAVPHPNPRNSIPALHVGNLGGPLPPRPVNPLQLQQNFPPLMGRPQRLLAPRPQLGGNLSFASGRPGSGASGPQQIYDPFSPTSVATASLQGGNPAMTKNQESDPEYEDLMASVGVK